jgi:hypothetical protein
MGGKFSHKLEVFLPWMLLNRNFLKENRYYPNAGWENFCAKIFTKLLLGQCRQHVRRQNDCDVTANWDYFKGKSEKKKMAKKRVRRDIRIIGKKGKCKRLMGEIVALY